MKKMIMMLVAVVMVAGSAQALSLNWGVDYFTYTDQSWAAFTTETLASGSTLWIVNLGVASYDSISVTDGNLSYGAGAATLTTMGLNGANYYDYVSQQGATVAEGDKLVAVFWDDGSSKYGMTAIQTVIKSGSIEEALDITFSNTSIFAGGEQMGSDGMIANVPEPTSLALLALGAVAIGLHRKFRK